jgi:hypothetical protein
MSLLIRSIGNHITHNFIANIFWQKEIAQVSSVTLIPQSPNNDGEITYVAYITFETYCETEAAYDFICRLKEGFYNFQYEQGKFWVVEKGNHIDGEIYIEKQTEFYDRYYYEDDGNIHLPVYDDSELEDNLDITYPPHDHPSLTKEYKPHLPLIDFNNRLISSHSYFDKNITDNLTPHDFTHLKNEVDIYFAILNSKNVTSRKKISPIDDHNIDHNIDHDLDHDLDLSIPILHRQQALTDYQTNLLYLDLVL